MSRTVSRAAALLALLTLWLAPAAAQVIQAPGGGGATGSVTAPGTSGSQAQNVQGITGGVPVRTDGSATTQPVSAASLPLPAGAVADATLIARLGTLGQKTMANSAPVVLPSDQTVPTQLTGLTKTRLTCTMPAYIAGGTMACTDASGTVTNTTCAASTACLLSAANASRKTAQFMVRTTGATCDVGFSSTVAPGNALGLDGPASTTGKQGGYQEENPAHVGTYYGACSAAATLVVVQGQ